MVWRHGINDYTSLVYIEFFRLLSKQTVKVEPLLKETFRTGFYAAFKSDIMIKSPLLKTGYPFIRQA
jgi:hypothetical protein